MFGDSMTFDQVTMLFMKIDANSDGTVDWNEFSSYMISGSHGLYGDLSDDYLNVALRERIEIPHKDPIKSIHFVQKERKYLSISKEGNVCIWMSNFRLVKSFSLRDLGGGDSWILDTHYINDQNRLIAINDGRSLLVYDIMSIKPRMILTVHQLEHNPRSVSYAPDAEDGHSAILFGDDGGYVNILYIPKRFWSETVSEMTPVEILTPNKLTKKSLNRNNMHIAKKKVNSDWITKIVYHSELNSFVACSPEKEHSIVIGDMDRRVIRSGSVQKGVLTFDVCKRPSFVFTGGRDRLLRVWNPYVLTKPAAILKGHKAPIQFISVNNDSSHVMSLSEDKQLRVWDARTLTCIQVVDDPIVHRPEDAISCLSIDRSSGRVFLGSDMIDSIPLCTHQTKKTIKSHDAGVVAAMFNDNFHQVVSGCLGGTIRVWDVECGLKVIEFNQIHDVYLFILLRKQFEITAMSFDHSGRRLITGSKDGVVKMWNFSNGQILKQMVKDNKEEVTGIIYEEIGQKKCIITVGWDQKISIFLDDPDEFEAQPVRIVDAKATSTRIGHTDDILCITFCPPNEFATGGSDGAIVIWSAESNTPKRLLKDPLQEFRSKDELAVEKDEKITNTRNVPLVSCHADGFVRVWDHHAGVLLQEFDVQNGLEEGIVSMSTNPEGTFCLIGGSKGSIREEDESRRLGKMKTYWLAHVSAITSVSYVHVKNCIMTSGIDGAIRLWTMLGRYIGCFGQVALWNVDDQRTYAKVPTELELHYEKLSRYRTNRVEKNVFDLLEYWRRNPFLLTSGRIQKKILSPSKVEDFSPALLANSKMEERDLKIAKLVVEKWKDFTIEQKSQRSRTIEDDIVAFKSSTKHFSYEMRRKPNKTRRMADVQHENVFHLIKCHDLEDVPNIGTLKHKNMKFSMNNLA